MGRLSIEQIAEEVAAKGFTLVSADGYTSLTSPITVKCANGHIIEVSMADFRRPSFECPQCNAAVFFDNPRNVPAKNGAYRVVAFDQATEKFGVSIFDDGRLTYYKLMNFNGTVETRLVAIKQFVEMVIREWSPDFIGMEDIQYQYGAVVTYKILAMLLGLVSTICAEKGIPHEIVSPNVWRKNVGTCGKTRQQEKLLSVAVVKEKYNIRVIDDVAEAILIGYYICKVHKKPQSMAFGNK